MRTFSRDAWLEAQQAWKDGEFSSEWRSFRHEAAMRGMIYPPEGSKWDSWDDDKPTQRAQLIRSIRETPQLAHEAIAKSRSWFEVVNYINRRRDQWRDQQRREDIYNEVRADEDRPTHAEAVAVLSDILRRIDDSRPA